MLPCPSSVQTSLTQNCLKLTIPGFPFNLLPVSCSDVGFKKILGLVLAWKSGLKVSLLHLRPSCPLQIILLNYLVGCDNPLVHFFKFKACQTAIIVSRGLSLPIQEVQIPRKVCQTTITICRGLSHPTRWAALPSENISQRFFGRRNPLKI
jgi:hypothetical protein